MMYIYVYYIEAIWRLSVLDRILYFTELISTSGEVTSTITALCVREWNKNQSYAEKVFIVSVSYLL